jgi:hypothetical protein
MIIGSISTIPGRVDSLIVILDRLLNSTIYPDILLITVADYYPRMNKFYSSEEMVKLLSYISSYKINTKIVYQDIDIGPIVKLKSGLDYLNKLYQEQSDGNKEIFNQNDVIIIIDDDSGLYEKTIELLSNSYKKYGDAIYGIMGKIGKEVYIHGEFVKEDYKNVDLLGGYRGVLYPVHLLTQKTNKNLSFINWIDMFIKEHKKKNLVAMHDDDIFYYWAKYNNYERRVVKVECNIPNTIFYNPITNTNGIFNDENCNSSLQLIENILKDNKLEYLI